MNSRFQQPVTPKSVLLTLVALSLWFSGPVSSQGPSPDGRTVIVNGREAVAGEVLVKFTRAVPATDRVQFERQLDSDISEQLIPNLRRLRSRQFDVEDLVAFFRARGDVEYVEPNYILRADLTPNDPSFPSLWGLLNTGQTIGGQVGVAGADIHATSAWDVSVGSNANVVAVIDTGIDYNHPDLAGNIWTAPAQFTVTIGGINITCAAGTRGFNAINRTCNPLDDNNHGTHVAGTIGALGHDGVGVAGVNWVASIMGAKFLNFRGSGSTSAAIDAIEFAIQAKQRFAATGGANVRVLSNSWGGGGFSQALLDEINRANANDMLFVASAGNSGVNTSTTPSYPASYNALNIISVAASDNTDHLASFSNYGPTVHLAAPGVSILSTTRNNTYASFSGTSMAAPHVSGVAALVLSTCALDTAALKAAILNNLQTVPALSGWVATGGRLDANAAIGSCATPPGPQPPAAPANLQATAGDAQVSLTWNAVSDATSYTVKRGSTESEPKTALPAGANIIGTSFDDTTAVNGTTYYYVVVANNDYGSSSESNVASATPTAPPAVPVAPTGLTAVSTVKKQIKLTWNTASGATSYIVKRAGVQVATVTAATYTDKGLTSGQTYSYTVAARNSGGTSGDSSPASATAK